MDKLDKMLFSELKREEAPSEFKSIIKSSLNDNNVKRKHYSLIKIATTACASLLITAGIVYASTTVIEKIWKKPEKTVNFFSENNTNTVTEEEKKNAMSETEAKEYAKKLLKKFGYENEKIELIKLSNQTIDFEVIWEIKTKNNISINFNAIKKDEYIRFRNKGLLNKNIHGYKTNKLEAEKTAKSLCKKYGYDLEEYTMVKVYANSNKEDEAYIWYVNFYKEYDGIVNPYQAIHIGFIPEINELYFLDVRNSKYENNPVEITEEQAKQIVLETESKIDTVYEIKNININLDIDKMNGDSYLRTTDYEQYRKQQQGEYLGKDVTYRTDNTVRKVWMVTIVYDIPETVDRFDDSFNPFDEYYTYYVDATTGEVIGGSPNYYKIRGR